MLKNGRSLSVLLFSFYFSWLLAFPFEGQILSALTAQAGFDTGVFIQWTLAAHVAGLIAAGFMTKHAKQALNRMLFSIPSCFACSLFFFFTPAVWWGAPLVVMSFLSGVCVAAWGFFYRDFTPSPERYRTAASGLAFSNLLMTVLNVTVLLFSPRIGLGLSLIMLATAFCVALRLRRYITSEGQAEPDRPAGSGRALVFLCLFILVITVNSGIMYQVVLPAFGHLTWLSGWYWALPYIAALLLIKLLPTHTSDNVLLYSAIALMGFSFTAFMVMDRSAVSYIVVITLLMGSCGIFDLYWWTLLGSMPCWGNPARTLGFGLAANVLGILVGGFLGQRILAAGFPRFNPAILALLIVFIILMILPALNNRLMMLFGSGRRGERLLAFVTPDGAEPDLSAASGKDDKPEGERPEPDRKPVNKTPASEVNPMAEEKALTPLSPREKEVVRLLLQGRTYKLIAQETCLSENTIKTHIRSIYTKLDVKNKSELIHLLSRKA